MDALTLTAASFQADVSTLSSDRALRDDRIHSMGLQSARYPTAAFALTKPVALPSTASRGATITTTITGNLTIHGVTRLKAIQVRAHLSGEDIEVVGSVAFPWTTSA